MNSSKPSMGPPASMPRRSTPGVTAASSAAGTLALAEQYYRSDPQRRVNTIRKGVTAATVVQLFMDMGIRIEDLISILHLSSSDLRRKARAGSVLAIAESERVLGVAILIGLVQSMVEQCGTTAGFDAPRWLAGWWVRSLPALGGATPASYMDTFEGQALVADLLLMSQSGAFA